MADGEINNQEPAEEVQAPSAQQSQIATYVWSTYDINVVSTGTLVGIHQQGKDYDLSMTGCLRLVGNVYKVTINGHDLELDQDGKVVRCTPQSQDYYDKTLMMVTATMDASTAIGGAMTRSNPDPVSGYTEEVTLTVMEPRDNFAVQTLNAMLIHADHPETFNDAKMLYYARAAYKWAQAMMIAAADSRHGSSESQSQQTVDINTNNLQSNTEQLLYNIGQYLKTGVAIKDLEKVTDSYEVPFIDANLYIDVSIWKTKQIKFEFRTDMAYSDIYVYMSLAIREQSGEQVVTGTRKVGFTLAKGTIVQVFGLDELVTDITSISTMSIRGQGVTDRNSYVLNM